MFFQEGKLELLINSDRLKCSDFLKLAFEVLKERNPKFSIRLWAKEMGFPTHTTLARVLLDQYRLNPLYFSVITQYLKLSPVEIRFFEYLMWMEFSKNIEERDQLKNDLKNYYFEKKRKKIFVNEDAGMILKKPLHSVLLELVGVKGFSDDLNWIHEKLKIPASKVEIKKAIERLIELNLLAKQGMKLVRSVGNLRTANDKKDVLIQSSHSEMLQWASSEVLKQDVHEREFQSYVLSASEESLPLAKKLMREFVEEFSSKVEAAPGTSPHLYQFSLQFFKITNDSNKTTGN